MVLAIAAAHAGPAAAQATRVMPMATGSVAGAYFPAGVALCRVVNETRRSHGIRCAAEPTEASLANVDRLRAGDSDLALIQSDVQEAAWRGAGPFAEAGPFEALRAIAALYPEPLTLVAAADADVGAPGDLAGKRVSLGPAGSGQRAMIDALGAALGWREGFFGETAALDVTAAVNALCEGRLDAFFYAVGHPALAIREATSACGARLVPIAGPEIEALIAASPLYSAALIPAGLYPGVDAPTPTFGVAATLVTRADVPDADVETVTREILDSLAELEGFAPTLAGLEPAAMARRGLAAPLHPGAAAAYAAAAD